MEGNINLYKFIFYKPVSAYKQHKYTHRRSWWYSTQKG